jgi:CBS domain-containing protein
VLVSETVTTFVEPAAFTLGADDTFETALALFAEHHADTVYIVEDGDRIVGVLTRTDLLRVVEVLSSRPISDRSGVPVRHFMTPDPVVVALSDTGSVATLLMWNRGLKSLPVVTAAHDGRLAGCLRAETVMQKVLQMLLRRQPVSA